MDFQIQYNKQEIQWLLSSYILYIVYYTNLWFLWRLNWSVLVVHLLITCFFVQVPVMLVNIDIPLGDHWMLYSLVLFVNIPVPM